MIDLVLQAIVTYLDVAPAADTINPAKRGVRVVPGVPCDGRTTSCSGAGPDDLGTSIKPPSSNHLPGPLSMGKMALSERLGRLQ